MTNAPLRICMFGTYESGFDRNQTLLQGLREEGAIVDECHVPVWETMRYKTDSLRGPLQYAIVLGRLILAYAKLCVRYLAAPSHDLVLVGYLGQFDVFPARLLSWLRRKPLVFDAFISLYDTAVEDRGVFAKRSIPARVLRWVDRWSCKLSDLVLLDTNQHIDYFCDEFGLDESKFQRVLVGADTAYMAPEPATRPSDRFVVLHYGKFAPLHGMQFILDAADRLRDRREIVFKIVGGGQTFAESKAYAEQLGIDNIELIPWLEPDELRRAIRESHVCLGIFGETPKASRVVPNKVYQCLAAGAAVVTGRSPASEELLVDHEHALLCEMANGEAIAEAIEELQADPALRERLGRNAAALFFERFTPERIVETELLPRLRATARI
jgi:glycosyltransferase involved in cell wall biosynthesis